MTNPNCLEFADRLKHLLRSFLLTPSPTKLARAFNATYKGRPISPHAARKWIIGEAFPAHDKMIVLAAMLGTTPQWLAYGTDAPSPAFVPQLTGDERILLGYFNNISASGRKAMLIMGAALAGEANV